jgi:hypothetical protein
LHCSNGIIRAQFHDAIHAISSSIGLQYSVCAQRFRRRSLGVQSRAGRWWLAMHG